MNSESEKGEKCECECKCRHRTSERDSEEYKRLMNRLNRIEGQIRGIKGMLERNEYCIDILTQTAAVNAALSAFSREILNTHIKTCVADGIKSGRADEVSEELSEVLKKLLK